LKYCRECGEKNTADSSFCTKCGTQFVEVSEDRKGLPVAKPAIVLAKPILYRRNFLLWWILTFVASPIYLVYLYFNFEDMNALEENDPNREGPSMKTKKDNIIMFLILSNFIPFVGHIVRYWKFDKFHTYLNYNADKNQTRIMSGKKRLWTGLIAVFFLYAGITLLYMLYWPPATATALNLGLFIGIGVLCFLIGMGLSIYLLYQEYLWQKAMNERMLTINPNAEEKQLF